MNEPPFDVYSDYVSYWTTHWGTSLTFHLQQPILDSEGTRAADLLGTVRFSNEHLKALLFNIARTLVSEERRTGANYDATDEILAHFEVSREGWKHFWDNVGDIR